MLADAQHFDKIEKILRDNGSIEKFERECGEVLGRVMIGNAEMQDAGQSLLISGRMRITFIGKTSSTTIGTGNMIFHFGSV